MGNHETADIQHLIDRLVERIMSKDLDGLKQIYAPEVVSFDIEPPLRHLGIAAKLVNWGHAFEVFDRLVYEVRDLTVVAGGDVAFGYAFARLSGTLHSGATTPGMWVRVTYGLQKINGAWLITHDQVSVPLDITSGAGVVDLQP